MGPPTLIAGITTAHFGLHGTALAYSAAVAGLATAAAGTFVSRSSSRTGPSAQSAAAASDVCPVPCTVPRHVPAARQEAEPAGRISAGLGGASRPRARAVPARLQPHRQRRQQSREDSGRDAQAARRPGQPPPCCTPPVPPSPSQPDETTAQRLAGLTARSSPDPPGSLAPPQAVGCPGRAEPPLPHPSTARKPTAIGMPNGGFACLCAPTSG